MADARAADFKIILDLKRRIASELAIVQWRASRWPLIRLVAECARFFSGLYSQHFAQYEGHNREFTGDVIFQFMTLEKWRCTMPSTGLQDATKLNRREYIKMGAACIATGASSTLNHGSAARPQPQAAVVVLDDCDPNYEKGKSHDDGLRLLAGDGSVIGRIGGLNNCQSISMNHGIALDPERKRIYARELVERRITVVDLAGTVTSRINEIKASSLAIDPKTGDLWCLVDNGTIDDGEIVVLNNKGISGSTLSMRGTDIVYNPDDEAFWVVGRDFVPSIARAKSWSSFPTWSHGHVSRLYPFSARAVPGSSSGDIPKWQGAAPACCGSVLVVRSCKRSNVRIGIRWESLVSQRQAWRGSSTCAKGSYVFRATKILSSHCLYQHWPLRSAARAARSGLQQKTRSCDWTPRASLSSGSRSRSRPSRFGWPRFEFSWRRKTFNECTFLYACSVDHSRFAGDDLEFFDDNVRHDRRRRARSTSRKNREAGPTRSIGGSSIVDGRIFTSRALPTPILKAVSAGLL